MKREIIRVEPLATFLEKWKAPLSTVAKYGDTVYVTAAPPFEPETGEITKGDITRQTELVMEQMKQCLEAAGSSLAHVLKCNVYCTSPALREAINQVYIRYFPTVAPPRLLIIVAPWGEFDVEVDCIAAVIDVGRASHVIDHAED